MPQAVIDNPILNWPYREPARHFLDANNEITNIVMAGRPGRNTFVRRRTTQEPTNLGTFGRWAFLEIDGSNLNKTKQEIRSC